MISDTIDGSVIPCVVGIDPGTRKCGVAVVNENEKVIFRKTVRKSDLAVVLERVLNDYPVRCVVLGDGTGSKELCGVTTDTAKRFNAEFKLISEKNSTQDAYLLAAKKANLIRRFMRLAGLLTGFENPDSWAAAVIAIKALK